MESTLDDLHLQGNDDDIHAPPSPPRLSLLGLPTELRLRIYGYLPPLHLMASAEHRSSTSARQRHFAILHTNHQIHREAKPIVNGNIEVATSLLQEVPRHAIKHIRAVSVECAYTKGLEDWSCKPTVTPLGPFNRWPLENLWRYLARSVPNVQQIRVRGHVRPVKRDIFPPFVRRRRWRLGGETARSEWDDENRDSVALGNPETSAGEGTVAAILPALRCVVVESMDDPDGLHSFNQDRLPERFRHLVEEVEELSSGATVLVEHGYW